MSDSFDEALDFAGPSEGPVIGKTEAYDELVTVQDGPITYYPNLIQGSDAWKNVRCGLLTASEMKLAMTEPKRERKIGEMPTIKYSLLKGASNDKERAHVYELAGQRVTKYVEAHYISDDMLRGKADEIEARDLYNKHYAPTNDMGFITNGRWGFTLGFSPDGLVADNGFIEAKSRRQKYQMETFVEYVRLALQPEEYILQTQTGFLVTERKWCDFISFCGGLHMVTIRVWPDPIIMNAIVEVAGAFEERVAAKMEEYREMLKSPARLIPTERRPETDMHL
jgi:hypothetical protein